MWITSAFISMVLAGIVPVTGERASKTYDKTLTTTVRAAIILIGASISLLICRERLETSLLSIVLFAFAGLSDALGWLFFFYAVSQADAGRAAAVEKLSVPMTSVASFLIFREDITILTIIGIAAVVIGVIYGVFNKQTAGSLKYAIFAAIGTSAQFILSKIGLDLGTSSAVGFWCRSFFAFLTLSIVTIWRFGTLRADSTSTGSVISLLSTGILGYFAWSLCYSALAIGSARSVQAIMKLSFWVTAIIGAILTRTAIDRRRIIGYTVSTTGMLLICFT